MSKYHKIQTVFKRDPETKYKTLLRGDWSLPEFEYLALNDWAFTEKVDGTNIRIYIENGQVRYGGRTDNAQLPMPLVEKLNKRFGDVYFEDMSMCLYGEGYGAKIQKAGENYRSDQDFVLFDVNIGGWWLERENVEDIAEKLSLDIVPIIGYGTLYNMVSLVETGFNSSWGDFLAEGIVARPTTELCSRSGQRIITKLKYKDFPR